MRMDLKDSEKMPTSDETLVHLDNSNGNELISCDEDNVSDACILRISFKDAETFSELNTLITRCIKNALFHLQKSVICTEDPSTFTVTFNQTSKSDDGLFIVDSVPSDTPEISNVVPEYSRTEVLINGKLIEENKNGAETTPKTAQNACFNCDGDHSIRDCTKPRDFAKIKHNRAKFTNNKLSSERYHAEVEQKFGHFVAGDLTKDLRNALGLRSKELPMHIYRMRMLGYPPGWLENAKVSSSGLTMFDSEGQEDDGIENDNEDKYDLKKIISFPGFNVEAPHGTVDESRSYRAPPMHPHHSKASMIEFLRSKSTKAYKRKSVQHTVLESADMEIEDDVEDVPLGERVAQLYDDTSLLAKVSQKTLDETNPSTLPTVTPSEGQSPVSDDEIVENERKRGPSPTLDDLNERKKRLLVALDDSTVSISNLIKKPIEDDSLIEDIIALEDDSTLECSEINEDTDDTQKLDESPSLTSDSPPLTPKDKLIESIKSPLHTSKGTVSGTPVIKGVSPYSNLPEGEKWAAGVTELLDFQNLPESIGKYEKMRTLLGKVRAEVKKIQYENEDD